MREGTSRKKLGRSPDQQSGRQQARQKGAMSQGSTVSAAAGAGQDAKD